MIINLLIRQITLGNHYNSNGDNEYQNQKSEDTGRLVGPSRVPQPTVEVGQGFYVCIQGIFSSGEKKRFLVYRH